MRSVHGPVLLIILLLAGCSAPEVRSSSVTDKAADVDLGPLASDQGEARTWLSVNDERIENLVRIGETLVGPSFPPDCDHVAGNLHTTLGDLDQHLEVVATAPDKTLEQLLVSATVSVRSMIGACAAGDESFAELERPGLAKALALIERRVAQVRQ